MTAHDLAEHLFDVANQFNRGALVDQDERAQVATINLRAGERRRRRRLMRQLAWISRPASGRRRQYASTGLHPDREPR
jgi:hypothetical protein